MSRSPWIALSAVLLSTCITRAQAPANAAVSDLVKNFLAAEQAYDAPALAKLVSDRYVEISPAGEVDAHDRFLGFYTPDKKQPWPPMTVTEPETRTFGNTAIETVKLSYSMAGPDGQMHTRDVRGSFIAQNEAGTWKLIGAQYTGIRPAPAPKP